VPGRRLMANVTTRDGRRLSGRLVYDFDESETTETLDVPRQNVDYHIPFTLIKSMVVAAAKGSGRAGSFRAVRARTRSKRRPRRRDAGVLVFVDGASGRIYVSWGDVAQIDFDAARGTGRPVR